MVSLPSCDSYFDDVPNNAVSIDDIFENRGMTLGWLTNIYSITPDWTNREASGTAMYWNGATIEGYLPWDWVETHDIITGTMSSSTKHVNRIWSNLYKGIQNCNIYLARVDGCDPLLPEEKAAFINKGAAAKTAIIIPIKCVIALPGSRIVICIKKPPLCSSLKLHK